MKNNKSFVKSFLIQNIIYLTITFAIFLLIYKIIDYKLDKLYPMLPDLMEYDYIFKNDDFSKIPLDEFKNCQILIYDENGKSLYSTGKDIEKQIGVEDLQYINDYRNSIYYRNYDILKNNDGLDRYIMKIKLNTELDKEELIDFAILDKNLKVKSGTLFGDKTELTEFELKLINGTFGEDYIEKYTYKNLEGKERTVIFIEPEFTSDNYENAVNSINKLWILTLPVFIIIIFLQIVIYKRKLKQFTKPLNDIISFYKDRRNVEIYKEDIPREFQPLANNFTMLLNKIDKNSEDKNKMIANISHDLKTPLTAIQGYTQAFKDGIVPEDKKEQYLNAIYDKAIFATDLINKLFEYTKLEHPNYNLKLQKIDIVQFIKKYVDRKRTDIELKGFIILDDLPNEIAYCNIDEELFTRLYDNLLINSMEHNSIGTKILFKIIINNDKIKLIIADNGRGIKDEIKESLFEPFVTGDEARTSGQGTGLGMSIIKTIVDLHKGKICLNENDIINGYTTEFDIEIDKI